MNFLRPTRGMSLFQTPSFRQFSESSFKTPCSTALTTLSFIKKVPKALFKIAFLGFTGCTAYCAHKAHQSYLSLKKEAKETLSPIYQVLEKLGVKEPEPKEEDLTQKTSSLFHSILSGDLDRAPLLLETLKTPAKELEKQIVEQIETLEKKLAAIEKEPTSSTKKTIPAALNSLAHTLEDKILHELESEKNRLKKEIEENKK